MSQKTKYILSIILGFVLVFAIGIGSIKLFRAKRSTAPEADLSSAQNNVPTKSSTNTVPKDVSSFPAEENVASISFANLPADVQEFFPTGSAGLVIYSIKYVDGRSGYRIERDRNDTLVNVYFEWDKRLQSWAISKAGRTSESAQIIGKNDKYLLEVRFNKLTDTTSDQVLKLLKLSK